MDTKQLQEFLDNSIVAMRDKAMKTSKQLSLGELILKLEAVKNKNLLVYYDDKKFAPTNSFLSWRGSYRELAMDYEKTASYTVKDILEAAKETIGKTLGGYKGGDYLMGKNTPIWVANWGESSGFKHTRTKYSQAVVDVQKLKTSVIIVTEPMDY